jgi:Divergent InlB B-repeat domain
LRTALVALLMTCAVVAVSAAGAQPRIGTFPRSDALTRAAAVRIAARLPGDVAQREAATWCGSSAQNDRTPNVVAGHPAHWIYAIPSDGSDRLASVAGTMQTDAETIAAWWQGQDASREPRDDLAQFSCRTQLDVSSLRLQHSSSQLSPLDDRFAAIVADVASAGFASRFVKYVVYYDGPAPSNICGQGGGFPDGVGYAVVYMQTCQPVPSSVIAIHELVHAYGAVPTGAPHMCPAPNSGHVCDAQQDLMYPTVDGSPLSGLTLDVGRDDYYGHAGAWLDIQDSPWLVQRDRQAPLALSIAGTGTVVSDVPGLQCTATCTTTWNADTSLVLTATPGGGAKFVRWGGACSGSFSCSVRTSATAGVTALFAPLRYRLSVAVSGRGMVRTSTGATCARRCSSAVPSYTSLRLTARPARGWRLKSWSGACRGEHSTCRLPMSADAAVRAVFARR